MCSELAISCAHPEVRIFSRHRREQALYSGNGPLFYEQHLENFHVGSSPMVRNRVGEVSQ